MLRTEQPHNAALHVRGSVHVVCCERGWEPARRLGRGVGSALGRGSVCSQLWKVSACPLPALEPRVGGTPQCN